MLKNNPQRWGLISVLLHWIIAITVLGLFALGWWMTDLTFYDPWYKKSLFIHKSIGILLLFALIARLLWRFYDPAPAKIKSHARWEQIIARITHYLLHLLPILIVISGYLISTADGRPISVFGWFEVPAMLYGIGGQEDFAGQFHWYAACLLIILVLLHVAGALKHQLLDKDGTLSRMLGYTPSQRANTQKSPTDK